jgi:heme-degrading monooxygenase HmoA
MSYLGNCCVDFDVNSMITFINTFTVLPEKQQEALTLISRVYTDVVKYQPGFISAKLLFSSDGTKVTAFALWEDEESLKALRKTQGFRDLHTKEFVDAIVSNESHIYETALELFFDN